MVVWGVANLRPHPGHAQGKDGRDHHHPMASSVWLAGGGIQGGHTYGATDDFGYHAVADRCHVSDLHATILHLLGLDYQSLTFARQGNATSGLTDVHLAKVLTLTGLSEGSSLCENSPHSGSHRTIALGSVTPACYNPSSSLTLVNASMANSRSSRLCARQKLHSHARLALRHDRIREADRINPFL